VVAHSFHQRLAVEPCSLRPCGHQGAGPLARLPMVALDCGFAAGAAHLWRHGPPCAYVVRVMGIEPTSLILSRTASGLTNNSILGLNRQGVCVT